VPDCVAESHEAERSEYKPDIRWQSEEQLSTSRHIRANVEDVDHGWPDDVNAIVEHRNDEGDDERRRKFASFVAPKEMRWAELEPNGNGKYNYHLL
jgi:hypothetical protein